MQPPQWLLEGSGKAADESKVTDLLKALQPLRVVRYLESAPSGAVDANWDIVVHTVAPGGAQHDYRLLISDRGSEPPVGRYQDLTFELDRDILTKLVLQ